MATIEGPSRLHVVRDTCLWVGGLLGIGYQTITGEVNPVLTGAFMAMLGLPGVTGIVSAVRSTTSSSSPSPSSSSSQPSSVPEP
jgi:hypothetical protein